MDKKLYNYLKKEWRNNNRPKYQKYFEEWIKNLTKEQIFYFEKLWLKENF